MNFNHKPQRTQRSQRKTRVGFSAVNAVSSVAKRFFVFAAALLLAACTVGPKYERPTAITPPAYQASKDWKIAEPKDGVPRGKWWMIFNDAVLNDLADQIQLGNQELRAAEAQYRRAQALTQQARAGRWPVVTGDVSVSRSGGGRRNENTNYDVGAGASWDADLWGRVRKSIEAGEATEAASAADLESVRLALQSELVLNYLQLRVLDSQRRLLDETAEAFQKSLQLTTNRYKAGLVARVDVVQAEAQLKSTQAQAIDTGVARAQLEHAIAVLLGRAPAQLNIKPEPLKAAMPSIPTGLPSELLERRPDIAAAERRVAAANAQIGVAMAARYPSLTLSASLGLASSSFANWLSLPSRAWAFGASGAQTLFDAGARKSVTAQNIAAHEATVANYRQTVLSAFAEVEDNLAALRILEQEAVLQADAVKAARQALELTNNQYRAGIVSYLNVVSAQTTLLANERTALTLQGRRLTAAAALVRALGGGWTVEVKIDEQKM
ncbi:MAG: efflux transporter outer membrane subunit [Betaproteobacteria bacterium]|nr:efflux transporter outer membrane subunit [Betaproteobacteria bacterium]